MVLIAGERKLDFPYLNVVFIILSDSKVSSPKMRFRIPNRLTESTAKGNDIISTNRKIHAKHVYLISHVYLITIYFLTSAISHSTPPYLN